MNQQVERITFAPTVRLPDGRTVCPPGWMWLMAFSRAGCEWATKELLTNPDVEQQIKWSLHLEREPDYYI